MARAKIPKASSRRGPLLTLFVLFADSAAAAELFRMVRWHSGVFCPDCELNRFLCKRGCWDQAARFGLPTLTKTAATGAWGRFPDLNLAVGCISDGGSENRHMRPCRLPDPTCYASFPGIKHGPHQPYWGHILGRPSPTLN